MCGTTDQSDRKFLSVFHDTFLNSDPIMGGELLRVGNIVFHVSFAAQKIDYGDVSMIKIIRERVVAIDGLCTSSLHLWMKAPSPLFEREMTRGACK